MSRFEVGLQDLILEEISFILSNGGTDLKDGDISRIIGLSPFLSTFPDSKDLIPEQFCEKPISESDMTIIAGLAKVIRFGSSEFKEDIIPKLLKIIEHMPYLNYEFFQSWEGIPPNDRFAFDLTNNLLLLAQADSDYAPCINQAISDLFIKFGVGLKEQLVDNAIVRYIPSWLGFLRALGTIHYEWESRHAIKLEERLRAVSETELADAVDTKVDELLSSEGNEFAKAFFIKYRHGHLSTNHLILLHLQVALNFLVRKIDYPMEASQPRPDGTRACLDYLSSHLATSSFILDDESRAALHGLCYTSIEIFASLETHLTESPLDSNKPAEDSQVRLLILSLEVAGLCCLHLNELKERVTNKIKDVLLIIYPQVEASVGIRVLRSAFHLISALSIHLPESHASLSNLCCKFITAPVPDVESLASDAVLIEAREIASSRLAHSVKNNNETATSTIHFLVNHLFSISTESSYKSKSAGDVAITQNLISAIAHIGQVSFGDDVSDLAVTMLCRQLATSHHLVRPYILEKLAEIVLTVPDASYAEILEVFSAFSQAETSADSKTLMSTILKCYYSISYQIHGHPTRCDSFLRYMLNLANDKGIHIQRSLKEKRKGVQITAISGELGILLPVLGQILSTHNFAPHLEPDDELQGAFRNFWFHCVIYDFVSESTWVKEWRSSMLDIAAKTPLLVPDSSGNYLDTDLEYNSVLRRATSDQELVKMRNQLTLVLPAFSADIKYLTFAQVSFLVSLYHIETMRSASGNFSFILNYFSNEGVNTSKIATLVEAIAEEVTTKYLEQSKARRAGLTLDDSTIGQLKTVLINCCHRVDQMHSISLRCAKRFFDAFPQLIYNRSILYTTLELLQLLWQGCEGEMQDEYCPIFEFTSQVVGCTIQLPDSYSYRKELLKQFEDAVSKWLFNGKSIAQSEMDNHLQAYLYDTSRAHTPTGIHFGRSMAMKYGRMLTQYHQSSGLVTQLGNHSPDNTSQFAGSGVMKSFFHGRVSAFETGASANHDQDAYLKELRGRLKKMFVQVKNGNVVAISDMRVALNEAAAWLVIKKDKVDYSIIKYLCWIPVYSFTTESMRLGQSIWSWISVERGDLEVRFLSEIQFCWVWSITHHKGIFNTKLDVQSPFTQKMEYAPTDSLVKAAKFQQVYHAIQPHFVWIQFLATRYDAFKDTNPHLIEILSRILLVTFKAKANTTTCPLARESRFQLMVLGLKMLRRVTREAIFEMVFREELYGFGFAWFMTSPRWNSSGNKQLCMDEYNMIVRFRQALEMDTETLNMASLNTKTNATTYYTKSLSTKLLDSMDNNTKVVQRLILDKPREEVVIQFQKTRRLLQLLTENEISRLKTLNAPCPNPSDTPITDSISNAEKYMTEETWRTAVRLAWEVDPQLALHLPSRFKHPAVESELAGLILNHPIKVVAYSEALTYFLSKPKSDPLYHKWLLYWSPVPPISAASFLATTANSDPYLLQYSMRVLHHFPVDNVFFYVPQIVQALRYDTLGYAELFILNAAKGSQLFAHQIIWNMKANFYRNEETEEEDSLKPKLEGIIDSIVNQLSGDDKNFYEREFGFFKEVTGISGKLKPFIKKSKEEKKKKIDEEMKKIKVDVGVYLPSNPEGEVIDIDYKSGRPLQSHAKAPFMATFKLRKEVEVVLEVMEGEEDLSKPTKQYREVWQSAIFKVGDDCRQDVLALQLIAIFKNIYSNFGLDLYLFPYRIIATAPGCGVIDVIPNSISRDQLGREKVNDLNNYFLATYGGYNSIAYQKARNAYVQSVAAYSVVSYILQIKDRHNGNIMVDKDGHTIHIDFGFIFEISPGGINFESSPFKLTTEMIQVMGGTSTAQPYRWFAELCVKAYLAIRPYAEEIIQVVQLMLDSGLPCFKGDGTIRNLRWRFQLDKSERAAADFMMARIAESYGNKRTVLYDSFQFATNGIPH